VDKDDRWSYHQVNRQASPGFYILPKDGTAGDELFHILSQQLKIRVEWKNKLTDMEGVSCFAYTQNLHINIRHFSIGSRGNQE
jgi:hypothetical protein